MAEVERALYLLVSIAKIDAELTRLRNEFEGLPIKIDRLARRMSEIDEAEREAAAHLEEMRKERRSIELKLEDNQEQIKKYRSQLMEVKTNKEYTAMLHEIEHVEKDIDGKEERLLILMDELDQQAAQGQVQTKKMTDEKMELNAEKTKLEERMRTIEEGISKLAGGKPDVLNELGPKLKGRYDRVLAKMGDFAVTNLINDTCQGCFTRVTPQSSVEIRKNNRIVTCEACGRILVHYES